MGKRASVLSMAMLAGAALLAGCVGGTSLKHGATHVKLQTDQSEQELSFGIIPASTIFTDATINGMQRSNPNWHIFLIASAKEPRNADVIVRTSVDCNFLTVSQSRT